MTRLRTLAACDASAARQFAPWRQEAEDRVIAAWRAVEATTPADAAQERDMVEAMMARLARFKENGRG